MKNKFLGLFVFLFALVSVVSCDTEPLDEGLEPISNDSAFSVKFNNNTYSTDNVSAIAIQGNITLTAEHNSGVFVFMIEGDQAGVYSGNDLNMSYITSSGETYTNVGGSGATLAITVINYQQKTITGTFNFTGAKLSESGVPTGETLAFTQGVFTNVLVTGNLVNPDPEEPTSGDYFPMAVGNTWNYTNDASLVLGATQVVNGKTYYKETNSFFIGAIEWPDLEEFVRKENGIYYSMVKSVPNSDNPIQPQEIIILKDNLAVGGTWTSTFSLTYSDEDGVGILTVNSDYVIEQKDVTLTVNGTTYQNVIKVKSTDSSVLTINGVPFGEDLPGTTETWFAKDIGIIKMKSVVESEPDEIYDLTTYTLN